MLFDFLVPERLIFGPGSAGRLGEEAARFGKRVLLVTGRNSLRQSGMIDRILFPLQAKGLEITFFSEVPPEPTLEVVARCRALARACGAEVVIGAGGGSVLDVAKAAAGLYYEEGGVEEYFHGRPVTRPGLPWLAVPTTAGSGAEATRNAVLSDPASGKKQSIRCDFWMARVAVVDPVLTMTMPPRLTAVTGMDALTHAVESYTSRWAHPLTEGISLQAILLLCRNLYTAYQKGSNREAREKVALGSLMAGIALNNARLGAVHGLAHPVGLGLGLPHGLVCAVLLPYVMEFNLTHVEEKYARVARELGLATPSTPASAAARSFVGFVRQLRERLGLPGKLGELGLTAAQVPEFARAALPSGSLAANPRAAGYSDLVEILQANL